MARKEHENLREATPRGPAQPAILKVEPNVWEPPQWLALALLGLVTLTLFGDVLFFPGGRVLSAIGYDLSSEFTHWRAFGFGQLRAGNLPLWNPHSFCGTPFFGGFQPALLYPLNLLFLLLPLGAALNWSIALHVYLAGAFTWLWTRNRGLHSLACLFSALTFMLGAPYFLHVYPGHLSNLCTMIWAPLLFLALDRIFAGPSLAPCLLGIFATAMAILAGHIQYVYYLALAAAIYAALNLVSIWRAGDVGSRVTHHASLTPPAASHSTLHAPRSTLYATILPLAAIVLSAAALTAVQLFTGLDESSESLRGRGVSLEFASAFSLAPENFLTLIAPWFFGDMKATPYWGRCYLYEMSLFIGVTGLALACYGSLGGEPRRRRFSITLVVISLLLALGAHTPLFTFLYSIIPGFNKFRGTAKFVFLAGLFLAMLAGIGLDRLLRRSSTPRALAFGTLAAGLTVCGLTFWLSHATMDGAPGAWWPSVIRTIHQTGEIFMQVDVPADTFADSRFPQKAGGLACQSLLLGGASLLVLSLFLFLSNRSRRWLWAVAVLGLAELFAFARSSLATFPLARIAYPAISNLLRADPGDYRVLNLHNPNSAMTTGAQDIWGDDPGVLRRSAEFLAFTQGIAPEDVRQYVPLTNVSPAFALLRCKFVFPRDGGGLTHFETKAPPLPRLLLVEHCRVLTNQIELLAALTNASFNPRQEVILETIPQPWPAPAAEKGTVKLLDSSTDHLSVEADLKAPALLLITDSYSRHWRAHPLPDTAQSSYQILPADYCLRAVPLAAGHHHLRLEYSPLGFRIGKWVSLISLGAFLALLGLVLARQTGPTSATSPTSPPEEDLPVSAAVLQPVNIPSRSSRQWLPAALIFAFIFLAYLPSLKRESIWDDDSTLFQNPLVKASDGLYHVWCSTRPHDYWPLTFTSFWLEWRLWGANPLGYRITNILLHALGVVLLWKILCRLKLPGAWWAALIYGLHPVCVASVAWISERKNTLSLPFFLLSIWWYLRAEEERNVSCVMCQVSSIGALPVTQHATPNTQHATRFYLLSLLAFLLALLSKTSVVMLPVVLLLVVWWRRGQRSDIRDQKSEVRSPKSKAQCPKSPTFAEGSAGFHASRITHHALRLLPFFALSLALGVVTVWFQQHRAFGSAPPSAPMLDRLAASAWSPWFYVSKALAPLNLSVLYGKWPVPAFWFSSLLALGWCALLALLWYYRKRLGRGWFFGFAYFTISLLPVLGFFDLYYFNYSWVADHWQYLALIGIVVPLTCGFWFWAGKWKTRGLLPQFVVGAAALVLGVSSCWRAVLYGSSELLWQDALKKNPRSWVACNNLANALDDRGRADEALNLYQAALQLNPDYVEALNNLATLEVRLGKETDALAHYSEALRLNPAFAEAHNNLASLLLGQGKLPEARAHFVEALRLQPDYADAAYNLGNLLEKEGKPADAFRQYVLALRLNPKFAQAYYNAGNLRAAQGDYLDAARFFSKAVDIAPAFAEAQFNLGLALQRLGRAQEADLHLRIALRLNPALAPRPSGQLPLEKTAPK